MGRRGVGRRRRRRRREAVRVGLLESLERRLLFAQSTWAFPSPDDGRLLYSTTAVGDRIPDFSRVGYKTGNVPLPNTAGGASVPVKRTLNPGAPGVDMTATIQAAIDDVENDPLDANGFRGAVRLTAGEYPVSGTLNINASGVVLMGDGDSLTTGTVLRATGTTQRFLLRVEGSGSRAKVSGTEHTITNSYVPVGATTFNLNNTAGLAVGDRIVVHRPSTANWIDDIDMDLLDNPWQPGSKDLNFERTVTAIAGTQVTVDVPLGNSFDQQYGGGDIYEYTYNGRINNVGVSDIYFISDEASRTDLNHATGSITMDDLEDGWIHNVTSDRFAVNHIVLSGGAKFTTVDDVVIQNTSTGTQAPPAGLSFNGGLNLATNLEMHGVYHAIALGASVPGPNVFYDVTSDGVGSDCGPHQRWAAGGLFDDVSITGHDLQANNRGNSGTGHGWAGANFVFWNCAARNLEISNPPTAQNWAIGCVGTQSGNGIFESLGANVSPPISLYQKQLWDRTHANPLITTAAAAAPNPRPGSTTNLSVAASATTPLTYTWSVVSKPAGAADPTYSVNGTAGANNTVATMTSPGTYVFKVIASDAGGLLASSTVIVTDRPTTALNGDQQSSNQNDVFVVSRSGNTINVLRNGVNVLAQDFATSPQLAINAAGGSDAITIDFAGGNPIPANGLIVDAGAGTSDAITVTGTGGADSVALAAGNVSVNGAGFGYVSAEAMTLNLGTGGDTLNVTGGNGAVTTSALALNVTAGGALTMGASSALPDFTDLSVASGATFTLNGQNQTVDALTGAGTVRNGSTTTAATFSVGRNNSAGSFSGSLVDGAAATLGLTKLGTGTLVLSGANSYTGISTISGGVIESGNAASFAALAGTVRFNGGTFRVTADTVAANVSNKWTTAFSGAPGSNTGTFDVAAGATLTLGAAGGPAAMRTAGDGSGGPFIKTGAGTLRLLTGNNQQDDPLRLDAGTIVVEHADALGRGDTGVRVDMKSGTTLVLRQNASTNFQTPIQSIDAGGTVNVVVDRQTAGAGVTHSLNALTSSGAFTLNVSAGANVTNGAAGLALGSATLGGNGTFSVGANAAVTVSGAVGGAFGLTKTGAGTLVLNGANTYTGVTQVNVGALGGAGSVTADLTNAAMLRPGTSAGVFTVNGNFTQTGAGTLEVELNGTTAGTEYDRLAVVGTVALAGQLAVSLGFTPTTGQTFVVLDNAGVDPIAGTFAGLPQNATLNAGGQQFRVSYTGGDGNDVTLTTLAAPLPAVTATFVAGAAWNAAYRNLLESTGDGEAAFGYRLKPADSGATLAWSNLDQLSLRFDRAVTLDAGDLVVTGVNVASYGVASFSYDAATFTATWTLNRTVPNDKLTFAVDLDGVAGADYTASIRVLPGDVDRNGAVNVFDFNVLKPNLNVSGAGVLGGDLNGDNLVNVFDFNEFKTYLGKTAPP